MLSTCDVLSTQQQRTAHDVRLHDWTAHDVRLHDWCMIAFVSRPALRGISSIRRCMSHTNTVRTCRHSAALRRCLGLMTAATAGRIAGLPAPPHRHAQTRTLHPTNTWATHTPLHPHLGQRTHAYTHRSCPLPPKQATALPSCVKSLPQGITAFCICCISSLGRAAVSCIKVFIKKLLAPFPSHLYSSKRISAPHRYVLSRAAFRSCIHLPLSCLCAVPVCPARASCLCVVRVRRACAPCVCAVPVRRACASCLCAVFTYIQLNMHTCGPPGGFVTQKISVPTTNTGSSGTSSMRYAWHKAKTVVEGSKTGCQDMPKSRVPI